MGCSTLLHPSEGGRTTMIIHRKIITALAVSLLATACANRVARQKPESRLIEYASQDERSVRGTLVVARTATAEGLAGVTDLGPDFLRAVEQAKLDADGRLVRLDATLGSTGGDVDTRVVLDASSGRVSITTASVHIDWSVPTDLPWVWAPLLTMPGGKAPVTTPVLAAVAVRAARGGRAVRMLDLGKLESYAVTGDQLAVTDEGETTVIIGNDFADVEKGIPSALHLGVLETTFTRVDSDGHPCERTGTGAALLPWSQLPAR